MAIVGSAGSRFRLAFLRDMRLRRCFQHPPKHLIFRDSRGTSIFGRVGHLIHDGFYIMKSETPLLECFAKIEWAKTEIDKLVEPIGRLTAVPRFNLPPARHFPGDWPTPSYPSLYPTGVHKVTSQIDANGIEVWRFAGPEIPSALNVSVGAILHDLRSPLDQMLSTVALQKHASASGVAFPFGRTKDEFKTALSKQDKLPADVRPMLEILKPYRNGGNALLYAIHALNKPDKHRPGLVPVNLQTVSGGDTIATYKGAILSIGPRTGYHFIADMDGNLVQPDISKAPGSKIIGGMPKFFLGPIVGKPPRYRMTRLYNQTGKKIAAITPDLASYIAKAKLRPGAPKDDMEIATTIPGTKFEINVEPTFNIALGDIEGFEREPAVAVLHQMRQLVERILLTFEKRFFR